MPRGRPKTNKKNTTGPVRLEEAVVVEEEIEDKDAIIAALRAELAEKVEEKEEKTPVKKTITYQKVKLNNLVDHGDPLSFIFEGKHQYLAVGEEIDIPKTLVDHLKSASRRKTKDIKETFPGSQVMTKTYTYHPRVMCEVLETYEKEA